MQPPHNQALTARPAWHRSLDWLLLIAVCLTLYASGITSLPPVDRDEARFAQATRQMLENHDYVRIRFQEQPRHKKPIGIYWLQAAAVSVCGTADRNHIWPYRLPSILGALLAVVMTVSCGGFLFDRPTGLLAGMLLASCLLLTVEAHLATTDAMLLATIVTAQAALGRCYLHARADQPVSRATALAFWLAQGLGWLLKGPVITLISLLTAGSLAIADRQVRWLRMLRIPWGLALLVVMLSPWAIAVNLATQGTFFHDAVRSDLLPKLMGGQESHGFPPGYYLVLLPLTFWPGSILAGIALYQGWKHRMLAAERFCLAWCLPTWLVFELIPTKLPHYILPAYPALALLGARALTTLTEGDLMLARHRWLRWGVWGWGALSLALGAALVAIPWRLTGRFQMVTVLPAVALLASSLAVQRLWRGRFRSIVLPLMVASVLSLAPTLQIILPHLDSLWLSRSIAQAVTAHRATQTATPAPIAVVGYEEPSLVFLLGTDTKLLSAEQAACYLDERPDALVVISSDNNQAFQEKASELGIVTRTLETIHGLNYTKGRWLTIQLHARQQSS